MNRKEPAWLKNAVFYQIYPSSFYDSNGDGIGDIPGIISKLDYLENLGINAIWISPCFKSPFRDGGYDVSDYRHVDPRYGTDADLDHLFAEAGNRGIKVCLDMVAGHTSTEHPWFKASCRPEKNEYSNYYIWNDSWIGSTDGLPMITGVADRDASFMINYFAIQPALNYGFAEPNPNCPWQLPVDHPDVLKVREELKNNMRYWLDKGASGFRVDMAASLVKRDPGKKETIKLWQDVRQMFDREYPDAVLISEWTYAPQALKAGFHCDFMIHCGTPAYTTLLRCEPKRDIFIPVDKAVFYENDGNDYQIKNFNSYFDASGLGDADAFFDIYLDHLKKTCDDGYISIPTGNHDEPRVSDFRSELDLKVFFAFLLTMPGVPFIYYGDEIGMKNQPQLTSKEGGFTRTQARTPMQWDRSDNAGFSSAPAELLYLPVDASADAPCVSEQQSDSGSLWNIVKQLISIRKSYPALAADGGFALLVSGYPIVYERTLGNDRFLMVIQPANRTWTSCVELSANLRIIWSCGDCAAESADGKINFSGSGTSAMIIQLL